MCVHTCVSSDFIWNQTFPYPWKSMWTNRGGIYGTGLSPSVPSHRLAKENGTLYNTICWSRGKVIWLLLVRTVKTNNVRRTKFKKKKKEAVQLFTTVSHHTWTAAEQRNWAEKVTTEEPDPSECAFQLSPSVTPTSPPSAPSQPRPLVSWP